jgi:hypothetical protein
MSNPRKHHYVTSAYLAAWTKTGEKDSPLQFIDKVEKKTWPAKPDSIAKETDLYILDLSTIEDEDDAMAIERALANLEGAAVTWIKRFNAGTAPPTHDNLCWVFSLAATLMVRSPKALSNLTSTISGGYIKGSSPSRTPNSLPAELAELIGLIMAKHTNQTDRPPGQVRNEALALAFSQVQSYFALFKRLLWTRCRPANDAGEFVCSDHPVLIQGFQITPDGDCINDGDDPTRVYFPIGPQAMLVGYCMGYTVPEVLDKTTIAALNARVIGQAERCVIYRSAFFATTPDGGIEATDAAVRRWTAGPMAIRGTD